MFLETFLAADIQNFFRRNGAFRKLVAQMHVVVFMNDDVLVHRDQMVHQFARGCFNGNDLLAAGSILAAEAHNAFHACNGAGVLGLAGFEQFRHAGQTAGDVLRLGYLAGRLGHHCAGGDGFSVLHSEVGACGNGMMSQNFAGLGIADDHLRVKFLLVFHHDKGGGTGFPVRFLGNGDADDHILEFDDAALFCNHGHVVRIPGGEGFILLDSAAVGHVQDGADDGLVGFQFAALFVFDADGAVFIQDDEVAVCVFHRAEIFRVDDAAVVLGFHNGLLERRGGRSAHVERTHGELRAGFADGLGGNNADRFPDLHFLSGGQVQAVALGTAALFEFAGEYGADFQPFNADFFQLFRLLFVNEVVDVHDNLAADGVNDAFAGSPAVDTGGKGRHFFVAVINGVNGDAVAGAAVFRMDDDILGHVHEFAGHVAGVRRFQRGICQTLAGAVGGDEVFQHGKAFTEVGRDGAFDNFAAGFRHQTAHAGELLDLRLVASGSGVHHHEERAGHLGAFVVFQLAVQSRLDDIRSLGPDVHHLLVAFPIRDNTVLILAGHLVQLRIGFFNFRLFLGGNHHVHDADGAAGTGCFLEAQVFQGVQSLHGTFLADGLVAAPDDVAHLFLAYVAVNITEFPGPDFIETHASGSSDDNLLGDIPIHYFGRLFAVVRVVQADPVMVADFAGGNGVFHLVNGFEEGKMVMIILIVLYFRSTGMRQEVRAQNDVLRGCGNGLAGSRGENIVGRQHELPGFHLRFHGQRHVHSHLVAVEVRVVRITDERVQTDGGAFNQNRFKSLDGEAVQGGRAVEHDRVALGHFFQNIPHFRRLAVNELLGGAHRVHVTQLFQTVDDEGFKQNERHLLGKTALVEFQFRADDDNGAAGVVHALAEQVLAETASLALQHVGEGFEGAVAGAGDGTTVAAVVKQGIHGFLKHAFFITDDDFRSFEAQEGFQAVVAVDDAAVQVIQVGRCETAAFQRNQRAQVRRNDGQNVQNHPFRARVGLKEPLGQFQTLGNLALVLFGVGIVQLFLKIRDEGGQINGRQHFLDGFRAHAGFKAVIAVFVFRIAEFFFRQDGPLFQRGTAGIYHDVVFIVNHAFQMAGCHVQHKANAAGHAFVKPDMGNRNGQFNMAHSFAAHARVGYFHAAAVAGDALMLDALVLAAGAFHVSGGPEDAFAEQAAFFRLERAVVDGFRVDDFTE